MYRSTPDEWTFIQYGLSVGQDPTHLLPTSSEELSGYPKLTDELWSGDLSGEVRECIYYMVISLMWRQVWQCGYMVVFCSHRFYWSRLTWTFPLKLNTCRIQTLPVFSRMWHCPTTFEISQEDKMTSLQHNPSPSFNKYQRNLQTLKNEASRNPWRLCSS